MIKLDLAFSPAAAELIDAADAEGTRSRLEQASSWEYELKTWIEALREDRDDHYPEPVRACDSISLGISLLDDASIAQLNKRWRDKSTPTDVQGVMDGDLNPFIQALLRQGVDRPGSDDDT